MSTQKHKESLMMSLLDFAVKKEKTKNDENIQYSLPKTSTHFLAKNLITLLIKSKSKPGNWGVIKISNWELKEKKIENCGIKGIFSLSFTQPPAAAPLNFLGLSCCSQVICDRWQVRGKTWQVTHHRWQVISDRSYVTFLTDPV